MKTPKRKLTDKKKAKLFDMIIEIMENDGEWSSDTIQYISDLVCAQGYEFTDPNDPNHPRNRDEDEDEPSEKNDCL